MDRGNVKQAEDLYRKFLDMSPEPGPGRYFYYMLRWGALNNMGRICEAKGDRAGAIAYYLQDIKTADHAGNLIRARNLIWDKPFDEPTTPLSPRASTSSVGVGVGRGRGETRREMMVDDR